MSSVATNTKPPPPTVVPKRKSTKGQRQVSGTRLDNGLTIPQEAYCRARAMGMDVEESIMAIGGKFSHTTARKWEAENPKVRARIAEISSIATKNAIIKTGLDREWVLSRLMTVVERCMQAEPVLDKKGNETGIYEFDAMGANAALKMLGDTMGLFKPAETKPGDEFNELSDEDITRIVQQLGQETGLLIDVKAVDVGTTA